VNTTIGCLKRMLLAIAAIAAMNGISGPSLTAATVAVGTCVSASAHYTTIQAAINAVAAGSTIKVCPGGYPEQVVINKNLTLTGVSAAPADNPTLVIPAAGFSSNTSSLSTGDLIAAQILVASPATAVSISSLAVDGTGNTSSSCSDPALIGIYYQNASGTVNNVVARNQSQAAAAFGCQTSAGMAIFVESGNSGTSKVTIENSTVRGYQKNGITANEAGTSVTISGNSVVGAGPIDTGQNGIQVAFGATGKVENNLVADDIFSGNPSLGTASGILIYDSGNLTITGNSVVSTQNGIAIATDGNLSANGNTVSNNEVGNTELGDGIDLCSNDNIASGNHVLSSGVAGIHLDSSCGATGNGNTVSKNVINEACAGTLLGSGSGNTVATSNSYLNVIDQTLAGDICTPTVVPDSVAASRLASPTHGLSPARP